MEISVVCVLIKFIKNIKNKYVQPINEFFEEIKINIILNKLLGDKT